MHSRVKYEPEAAFNRALKRLMDTPPGAWRKSRGAFDSAEARPS